MRDGPQLRRADKVASFKQRGALMSRLMWAFKTVALGLAAAVPLAVAAQGAETWFNRSMMERRTPLDQYNAIGRSDDIQCTAEARAQTSQLVPPEQYCDVTMNPGLYWNCQSFNEQRKTRVERVLLDSFTGCMARRGWTYGIPPVATAQPPQPQEPSPPSSAEPALTTGTGFFVTAAGHLITNEHVVRRCDRITGRLASGEVFPLSLVASDPRNDLAVLKGAGGRAFASLRRSTPPLGERVVVYGFPLSGELAASGNLTTGLISASTGLRGDSGQFQISAPIQPGNSGGPVLDDQGLVVAVVQSKLDAARAHRVTGDVPQNVNFAIKGNVLKSFLEAEGIRFDERSSGERRRESAIAEDAMRYTVLVACSK